MIHIPWSARPSADAVLAKGRHRISWQKKSARVIRTFPKQQTIFRKPKSAN